MPVESTPPLVLHLLGTPRVATPDGVADLPLGKPLAALCYLALEPTGVERSDLARILWPGSSDSRARASIRQALWLIRKQTHPEVVREENGRLALDPETVRTDLDELERALAADRLEAAMELWDGGPLRGFTVPGAKHWHVWADAVRSRWETRMGEALERRAAVAGGEDRVVWLRHALSIRPYRVESWLALVHTHVDLRQPDEADLALSRLRKVADESDTSLIGEAEERLHLLRRAAFGDPSEQMVPELVGRSEEFSRVMDAWRSVRSGRRRVVGIVGPSGIGKSALAAEVVRHAELDEAEVVEVRGLRQETELEFGVVASVVADLLRRPGAAGISPGSSQVLRSLVPSEGDEVGPPPQPTTLSDAVADLLDAVSHEAPVVVYVDDAQWMDSASSTVLLRAMRRLENAEVLALWTCRPLDAELPHEALEALRAAEDSGLAEVVRLRPLTVAEVRELVALLLTHADPEVLTELGTRLHAASQGSPLHLVELLQGMRDRGHLRRDEAGGWSMARGALEESLHLPRSLSDTLDQRVHDLHADAHALGAELSRTARALAPADLQKRSGWPEARFDQALSTLFARGLVRWTRDDRVALAHDSLAERFADRPTSQQRRNPWPLVAVLVAVILVGAATWRAGAPASAPHGGGTLWVTGSEHLTAHRWSSRTRGWSVVDSIPIPLGGFQLQGAGPAVIRTAVGWDTVLVGYHQPDQAKPPVASIYRDGHPEPVYQAIGDAGFGNVAPNGRAGIVNAQPPDTSVYRMRGLRVDLSGRTPAAVLSEGPDIHKLVHWSYDGSAVAGFIDAEHDTLIVVDPSGRRFASRPTPHAIGWAEELCAGETLLFASMPPGQLVEYALWNWRSGEITPLQLPIEILSRPTCAPDGSAVAYLLDGESGRDVMIQTHLGGAPERVPVSPTAETVHWVPDAVSVPDRVEILEAPDTLPQGARASLTAAVHGTWGDPLSRAVEWRTSDPAVISVSGSGTLTANRPGTALVRAFVDGWIEDTVRVRVTPAAVGDRIGFSDGFATLDTLRWWPAGEPFPEPTITSEGAPALDLNGDGRYQDGIISRESFDLGLGGTAEITVRIDGFPRPDRNRVILCVEESEAGPDPHLWSDWRTEQEACLQWPAVRGVVDLDTAAVSFSVGRRRLGAIPLDTLLRTGRWERLALQIRADGTVSAVVGDSVVAIHPIRVRNEGTPRWRVSVRGSAVGTRVLLRDVTLWREERYRSTDDGGASAARAIPGGAIPGG